MNLLTQLLNGPVNHMKIDKRKTADNEAKQRDILASLPGTVAEIARRSGWGGETVRNVLNSYPEKVRKVYIGGNKGGNRYRFEVLK